MDRPNDFLYGQKVTPAPLAGVARGKRPLCRKFCIWWAKNHCSFRPFFSQNIFKIHLKNTKKKWVGPIFLRGKRIILPPTYTHLKLLGRRCMGPWRDIWNPFCGGRGLKYFSLSLVFVLSFLLFLLFFHSFLLFLFFSFSFFWVCACGVLQHPKHPPGHANEKSEFHWNSYDLGKPCTLWW